MIQGIRIMVSIPNLFVVGQNLAHGRHFVSDCGGGIAGMDFFSHRILYQMIVLPSYRLLGFDGFFLPP